MKRSAFSFLFFCWAIVACGQKNDYVWLQGYLSSYGFDTATNHYLGVSKLNFNDNPVTISYDSIGMNFNKTNTSYCDSDGNLLFYSNGIHIRNNLDEVIPNSMGLNEGPFIYQFYPAMQEDGYRTPQGIYAFNSPLNPNQYFLFHSFWDTTAGYGTTGKSVLQTLLDMSVNAGHGEVIYKNQQLLYDIIGPDISVCRHANGRDWWLVVNKRNSNCYYKILVDNTGGHLQSILSCGGDTIDVQTQSASVFSADGSKYVYFSVASGVNIFDFDRCSGELTNPIAIPIPHLIDSGWVACGAAISPNNRFLYIGATTHVYQYDLTVANIPASRVTVASYDGAMNPFGSYFYSMQLAPDGKIYESCGNGETVYHVINRPDEKGDSCLFVQHGIQLPSYCLGVPSFPNYRLGALISSACDTLRTSNGQQLTAEKEKLLKIYPNPATNLVTIDYGYTDWNMGGVSLELSNELGQVVYTQALPMYSGFQTVQVSSFPAGFYTASIRRKGSVVAAAKFAKQ